MVLVRIKSSVLRFGYIPTIFESPQTGLELDLFVFFFFGWTKTLPDSMINLVSAACLLGGSGFIADVGGGLDLIILKTILSHAREVDKKKIKVTLYNS